MLTGTHWIESAGDGDVILHLASDQRLSTRFNFHSHFWTEYLMADLQNYILKIIKRGCEVNITMVRAGDKHAGVISQSASGKWS